MEEPVARKAGQNPKGSGPKNDWQNRPKKNWGQKWTRNGPAASGPGKHQPNNDRQNNNKQTNDRHNSSKQSNFRQNSNFMGHDRQNQDRMGHSRQNPNQDRKGWKDGNGWRYDRQNHRGWKDGNGYKGAGGKPAWKDAKRKRAEDTGEPPAKRTDTRNMAPRTPRAPNIGKVVLAEPPFEFMTQVGQGTYGKVYKAVEKRTQRQFAMKRLRLDSSREGFPVTAAREIQILRLCRHPNIVRLCEIVVAKSEVYMALEYVQNDLAGLLLNKELEIAPSHAKSLIKQVLRGVAFLHEHNIIHRDIKGSNVLVNGRGGVKLADFGLAKLVKPEPPNVRYTNRVISLWYRPPELLLGAEHYSYEVDVWGVGCLLVELFLRAPLFYGKDEVSQIMAIFAIMGPPPADWPEHAELPWTPLIRSLAPTGPKPQFRLDRIFAGPGVTPACYELATQMLVMNPANRLTAKTALAHPYFQEEPRELLLDCGNDNEWHDWEAKQRNKEADAL